MKIIVSIFYIAFSLIPFASISQASFTVKPCSQSENLGEILYTFTFNDWFYKIYTGTGNFDVQRERGSKCEFVFSQENNRDLEIQDVNSDNIPDIIVRQKDIKEIYLFNTSTGNYNYTGMFGYVIGYDDPKWRIKGYHITRLDGNRDNPTYDLYKIVDFKQITVGRIYIDVFFDEGKDYSLVNEIKIFKITNGDWNTKKSIRTIAVNGIASHYFKNGSRAASNFRADDFSLNYFDKNYSDFTTDEYLSGYESPYYQESPAEKRKREYEEKREAEKNLANLKYYGKNILFLAIIVIGGIWFSFWLKKHISASKFSNSYIPLFMGLGSIVGIIVSYWFQPEKLRQIYSLSQYLSKLPNSLMHLSNSENRDVITTVVISCLIFTGVGAFVGNMLGNQKKQK